MLYQLSYQAIWELVTSRIRWRMQMNIWKITYLNCGEGYEFMIDHCSYTHNLIKQLWNQSLESSWVWIPFMPEFFQALTNHYWRCCLRRRTSRDIWIASVNKLNWSCSHNCYSSPGCTECRSKSNIGICTKYKIWLFDIALFRNTFVFTIILFLEIKIWLASLISALLVVCYM